MNFKITLSDKNIIYLSLIILAAFLYRIYFFIGHAFSDDAYYNFLAYTLYNGHFLQDYIGYPIMQLRIGVIAITAFSFNVFGTNEIATTIFPMLVSLLNVFLTYKTIILICNSPKTGLIGAAIMALFTTDVIFASVNFSDSTSALLINSGIYFLWYGKLKQDLKFSILSGIAFGFSMFFKINVVYPFILLAVLFLYTWIKNKVFDWHFVMPIAVVFAFLVTEGLVYYSLNGNFFFRFTQTELNYRYCWNDFFMKGSQFGYGADSDFWPALLDRIFIQNPKAIFLRRFNLFIPAIALIQSVRLLRTKKYKALVLWFLGLCILYIGFTTSLATYRPNVLRFSWYIFPIFMPAVALSAIFISRLKTKLMIAFFVLYLAASVVMCRHYEGYFKKSQNSAFIQFVKKNPQSKIYTDHHSKYGLDLIDGFKNPSRTHRILGKAFEWKRVEQGDWVVYNPITVKEITLQGHAFPDFVILKSKKFQLLNQYGTFMVYEKK